MDSLTKLATEIGHARDYGQMASAAARKLLDIVAELDAQHMAALEEQANEIWALVAERYVELPKDADGEYIRIGDVMAYTDNTKPMEVVALVPPAVFLTEEGPRYADMCRHYKPPTTEDVLREMADRIYADEDEPRNRDAIVAEYAKRLTLAEKEEE